jgi:tripartite-type tricarboxylate transporter receptor subunit TctC
VANNIPGGGALIGTNTLFSAKPDGLTIGILNGTGMTLSQLTDQKGVKYDMIRFTHLGRISTDEEFIYIGSKSPYKTLEALLNSKDKETKWVTEGKAGSPQLGGRAPRARRGLRSSHGTGPGDCAGQHLGQCRSVHARHTHRRGHGEGRV